MAPKRSTFVIEPVRTDDLRPIMRLAWKSTSHLYPAPFFDRVARSARRYFRVVRELETGHVVSFLIAAPQPGLRQDFLLLAIDPLYKGKGLRRALLRDVQESLVAEGLREFSVEVPLGDADALDLYRREGFEVAGTVESAIGQADHVIVSKKLAARR